jgi:arylsulfatase
MMRMISSLGASVGMDFGSQVSLHYGDTFPFTGTLHQVEIQLGQRSRKAAEATAKSEMSRQ